MKNNIYSFLYIVGLLTLFSYIMYAAFLYRNTTKTTTIYSSYENTRAASIRTTLKCLKDGGQIRVKDNVKIIQEVFGTCNNPEELDYLNKKEVHVYMETICEMKHPNIKNKIIYDSIKEKIEERCENEV